MKKNPKNKTFRAAGVCFKSTRATSQSHKVLRAAFLILLGITLHNIHYSSDNICLADTNRTPYLSSLPSEYNNNAQYYVKYDFEKIVDAIYLAEGGEKAKKPFGILSVPCNGYQHCRQICLNTVRNNYRRWNNTGNPGDFLSFLASRYAPVEAHPLNKFWLPNVRHFLEVMS